MKCLDTHRWGGTWAEIVWRANSSAGHVLSVIERASDAEVSQLRNIIFTQEDVLTFEVPVHEIMCMDVPQSQAYLHEELHDLVL